MVNKGVFSYWPESLPFFQAGTYQNITFDTIARFKTLHKFPVDRNRFHIGRRFYNSLLFLCLHAI